MAKTLSCQCKHHFVANNLALFPVSLSVTGPQLGVWCLWSLSEEPTLPASRGKASGHLWGWVGTGPMGTGTGPYWVPSAWSYPFHPQPPAWVSPAS